MISWFEIICPATVGKTKAREHGNDFSTFAFIPAITTTRVPDRPLHFLMDMFRVLVLGFAGYFDNLFVALRKIANAFHDVTHLRFNQKQCGGMANTGIWAGDDKD